VAWLLWRSAYFTMTLSLRNKCVSSRRDTGGCTNCEPYSVERQTGSWFLRIGKRSYPQDDPLTYELQTCRFLNCKRVSRWGNCRRLLTSDIGIFGRDLTRF
jgi:hypothetical protein